MNISMCNHLCLYKIKHEFLLTSLLLIRYYMGHFNLPCLSVNFLSNSEKPDFHPFPSSIRMVNLDDYGKQLHQLEYSMYVQFLLPI